MVLVFSLCITTKSPSKSQIEHASVETASILQFVMPWTTTTNNELN